MSKHLRIIHFNDVYNTEASTRHEKCGGAARFVAAVKSYREGGENYDGKNEPLVVFGGDAFFPSLISQSTLGKHIPPVLNAAGVAVASCGNHELDSGLDVAARRVSECNFPWLLSNVHLKSAGGGGGGGPLVAGTKNSLVLEHAGMKIGFLGLAESEWISTLNCVDPSDVLYEDFVTCTKRLVPELRQQGAEIIIAITHMRVPNDKRMCEEVGDIVDVVLGAHDHHYEVTQHGKFGCTFVKSGTDYRDFTIIDLSPEWFAAPKEGKLPLVTQHVEIMKSMPEDPAIKAHLAGLEDQLRERMKKVIGFTGVDLDCRFSQIRTRETNISNFVADCLWWNLTPHPDIVIINSGTLRTDSVVAAGEYTIGDMLKMLPMLDPLITVSCTGAQVIRALENGVSKVGPGVFEGRFPCVSGVKFHYDSSKEPGSRVIVDSVRVGKAQEKLQLDKSYSVTVKEYMLSHDGYNFEDCPPLSDPENMPMLASCVSRFFLAQRTAQRLANVGAFHQSVDQTVRYAVTKWRNRTRAQFQHHSSGDDDDEQQQQQQAAASEDASSPETPGGSPSSPGFVMRTFKMKPRVENRIVDVNNNNNAAAASTKTETTNA